MPLPAASATTRGPEAGIKTDGLVPTNDFVVVAQACVTSSRLMPTIDFVVVAQAGVTSYRA